MGLFGPSNNEVNLLRDMFVEAALLVGENCSITLYNKYTDSDTTGGSYEEPVQYTTGVFFDEYPTVRTLKSLNWYAEDEEILPSILYIPHKLDKDPIGATPHTLVDVDIREGSKVVVSIEPSFHREYKISNVKSPYRNVVFYTCKLVPWFDRELSNQEDNSFNPVEHDSKYTFFSKDK